MTPTPPQQKPRPVAPQREGVSSQKRNGRPGTVVRALVSALIVWHFAQVFLVALLVPATSLLVMNVLSWRPMAWYRDAFYLNQQHSFFAPNVGPGHLIHYELFDQNGRVLEDGALPDKKEHRPRLFYHRHMMLADQAEMPTEDRQAREYVQRMYLDAYGRHLLRTHKEAQSVRVQRVAHWPLPQYLAGGDRARGYQRFMQEIVTPGENRRINDQGYELLGEAVVRRSDLPPEPIEEQPATGQTFSPGFHSNPDNPNLNWQSDRTNVARRPSGGPR
jgi:hypothetical protein